MSPLGTPPSDLADFPPAVLNPATTLYRVFNRWHAKPWFFRSRGQSALESGRFDLAVPYGTCYVADDDLGAFLEVFQDWLGSIVPRPEIEARQLATVGVPDEKRVADCTDPRGVRFGLSNEIGSGSEEDRERTHRWADAFHAQRFDGVRYWIRHDLTQTRAACAVFHHAGAADWPVLERAELDDDLLERVRTVFGIDID